MNEKGRFKLLYRMLIMSITPLVLLAAVTLILAANGIKKGIENEFLEGLKNQTIAVGAAYDN
ncbi:MAG: hypothetical protein IK078_00420, partial [Lachnospiraceae bacterium]|nr:hypothetical protein [Lachnospiraceae bacterium]